MGDHFDHLDERLTTSPPQFNSARIHLDSSSTPQNTGITEVTACQQSFGEGETIDLLRRFFPPPNKFPVLKGERPHGFKGGKSARRSILSEILCLLVDHRTIFFWKMVNFFKVE